MLAGLLALVLVAAIYGPGLAESRVLLPVDLLEGFPPWVSDSSPSRPANGLLGDQVQQMHPWRAFAHRELAAGRFPWWNPHAGGGAPLFANGQSAVLFPLNLLVVWLPPETAATLVALLKPPLAAMGTALFLGALGAGRPGSVFAGVAWAFSGPMVLWLGWPHTNALLMIPYLFWATTRWLQTGSPGWWTLNALCVALQLLGGHPETAAHTLVALGIYVASSIALEAVRGGALGPWGDGDGRPVSPVSHRGAALAVGGWAASVAAGVALAGIQVAPLLAAIAESAVAAERASGHLARVVLAPETALTWLAPNFFGTPLAETFGPLDSQNYNETIGYVGLGTLALAALSMAWPQRGGWLGLSLATMVAAGLAYGVPGLTELRHLPGLSHAANTRFIFILAFGLACLAGLGLDGYLKGGRPGMIRPVMGLLAGVCGVTAGLALFPDWLMPDTDGADPLTPLAAATWRQEALWRTGGMGALWAGGLALVAAGASAQLAASGRGNWTTATAAAGVLAVLAADLLIFGARYNPMVQPEVLARTPGAVAFIQAADPTGRVLGLGEALLPNTATLFQLSDFRLYEPVAHRRLVAYFQRMDGRLLSDIRSRAYLFVWEPNMDLLSLAGVRWVLAPVHDERVASSAWLAAAGLVRRYEDATMAVWENPAARPRAYLAERAIPVDGEDAVLRGISSPTEPRAAVVEAGGDRLALVHGSAVEDGGRTEAIFTPGRAEVRVWAPAGGLLVVNDAFYSGWTAWVDGAPAPILRTNYLFMGLPVPPGEHVVVLEYRPPALLVGAVLSVVGLATVAGALVLAARRRLGQD